MCLQCTHLSVTVALPPQIFTTLTNTKKYYVKIHFSTLQPNRRINVENVDLNSFNYYLSYNTVHTAQIFTIPCHWVRFIGYLLYRIISKTDE